MPATIPQTKAGTNGRRENFGIPGFLPDRQKNVHDERHKLAKHKNKRTAVFPAGTPATGGTSPRASIPMSVSPEETDAARPRCGAGPVCQRGAGAFFHHSHARSPHCRKLRLLFFRPPRDAPAPVPASAGTGAACAGSAARSRPVLSSLEHIEAIGELQHDITVHLLTPRVAAP